MKIFYIIFCSIIILLFVYLNFTGWHYNTINFDNADKYNQNIFYHK